MLFNSIGFAFFLPLIFFLYWFATNQHLKKQNVLLLLSSYFFYACWDYRFLFLLIFSTLLDYYTGLKMNAVQTNRGRKFWFWLSILVNLSFLGAFKYYNFFANSFAEMLSHFGIKVSLWTIQVILPVGISFYTFHGLSYVIDIYKRKIQPVSNFIEYSVFVSFFPLLVAGPIERATHLLPQIQTKRVFTYTKAVYGLRQILWGLFKKIVIADTCADYVNYVFSNSQSLSSISLSLGALFFTFQIYCDFSGYSDIALGTARLFGIELLQNFSFPYFSRDIAEFWRRWHISLSSWFRDYLYIPLGGSKGSILLQVRNIFIIFIVSGFWHGANWTFIAWGALNAIYFLPLLLLKRNRNNIDSIAKGKWFPSRREFFGLLVTFCLTVFAWIFFRSPSIHFAFDYISGVLAAKSSPTPVMPVKALFLILIIGFLLLIEWMGREQKFALAAFGLSWRPAYRLIFYILLSLAIFQFAGSDQQFIYFQF